MEAVWKKAHVAAGSNPDKFRKDVCGAMMLNFPLEKIAHLGQVDHVLPISKGGKDDLQNLQPLHWKNNESKADNHPNWICGIKEN